MPTHRVTSRASEIICAGKKAGKTSREIAKEVKKKLGIELDQRTISRHIATIRGKPRDRSTETAKATKKRASARKSAAIDLLEPPPLDPDRDTLPEIEALEREAATLQKLLARDLPPPHRAALNSELRQTFASIRKANAAKREVQKQQGADLDWLKRKLKRFAEIDGETLPESDDADGGELPEAPRAAGVA
jgi:hypothetical protein